MVQQVEPFAVITLSAARFLSTYVHMFLVERFSAERQSPHVQDSQKKNGAPD